MALTKKVINKVRDEAFFVGCATGIAVTVLGFSLYLLVVL